MKMNASWMLLASLLVLGTGCVSAGVPPETLRMTLDERYKRCEDYQLVYEPGLVIDHFKRADGRWRSGQLSDSLTQYEASRGLYRQYAWRERGLWIGTLAGVGLMTTAAVLATRPEPPSRNTWLGVGGAGAGLVLTSLLVSWLWDAPGEPLAQAYNTALCDRTL